jgi:hypothetical protein
MTGWFGDRTGPFRVALNNGMNTGSILTVLPRLICERNIAGACLKPAVDLAPQRRDLHKKGLHFLKAVADQWNHRLKVSTVDRLHQISPNVVRPITHNLLLIEMVGNDDEWKSPRTANYLGGIHNIHVGEFAICDDQIRPVLSALLDQLSARLSSGQERVTQPWQDGLVMEPMLRLVVGDNNPHWQRRHLLTPHRLVPS